MQLSNRLSLIKSKIKHCNCICDIGTDHAYIPIELIKDGVCKKAIAGDINEGPLKIAFENVKKNNINNKIELRQGNGLEILKENESETIVVAGMGGTLICEILELGISIAKNAECLILQPMNDLETLREWLYKNGFEIYDEEMTREGNKIYNVICAKLATKKINPKKVDFIVSKCLIKNKDPLLEQFIKNKTNQFEKVINGLMKQNIIQKDKVDEYTKLKICVETLQKKLLGEGVMKMSYYIKDIVKYIEEMAPKRLAMDWDNVGLLVGDYEQKVKKIMVCLDVTSKVVNKAIANNIDLIISHHPFIFKGIKKINKDNFKDEILIKLIKNDICVLSAHTNLDAAKDGVNDCLANKLELKGVINLKEYKEDKIYKIIIFCPEDHKDNVRDAICGKGAGHIANYSHCTFITEGKSSFKPLDGTNPSIGKIGEEVFVDEVRIETVVSEKNLQSVLSAMKDAHPYEEVAYDLLPTNLQGEQYGFGKVGELSNKIKIKEYIKEIKKVLGAEYVRLIGDINKKVKRVAVFGGSYDGDLKVLEKNNVDLLITGDIKYHEALDIKEMGLSVIDAGHFYTESIILPDLCSKIGRKFESIDVECSNVEKDPYITV